MFAKIGDICRDPGYELIQKPIEAVKVSVTEKVTNIIEEMNKSFPMKQAKMVNKGVKEFSKEHPTASKVLGVMMIVISLILLIGIFIPPFVVAGPGGIILSMLAGMLGVASFSVGLVLFVNGKKFSVAVTRSNDPHVAVDSKYLKKSEEAPKQHRTVTDIFCIKKKNPQKSLISVEDEVFGTVTQKSTRRAFRNRTYQG